MTPDEARLVLREKVPAAKPYAKLEDCVGQKLVGTFVKKGTYIWFLVFENAYAMLELYGYNDGDRDVTVLRERQPNPRDHLKTLNALGLVPTEAVERHELAHKTICDDNMERLERESYERLKKKYGAEDSAKARADTPLAPPSDEPPSPPGRGSTPAC